MASDSQLRTAMAEFIAGLDYQLWGVRWQQEGRVKHLQVFIDHENGIDVDDCASVSRSLGVWLDVESPTADNYVLEVSSPGADRLLFRSEHYKQYIGHKAVFRLHSPLAGRKKWLGTIAQCNGSHVAVDAGEERVDIAFQDIREARLEPDFVIGSHARKRGSS